MSQAGAPLRVLVVDDSAVVRQVMRELLGGEAGITVDVAADPLIAERMIERARPDVIVLDLEMPRMDGITFLRRLMAADPLPVLVCSSSTARGSDAALRALDAGAVDVIAKPRLAVAGFLQESRIMLVDAVRAAAGARLARRSLPAKAPGSPVRPPDALPRPARALIALGASLGGTDALRAILPAMPAACPGIVVVQHMPEKFTAAFARQLDDICAIEVREAAAGDVIRPGLALVAPGGRHLRVRRAAGAWVADLHDGPLVSRHRPSVDVLFHSVAAEAGGDAVGALLSGMGEDGAAGLAAMRAAGAPTLVQDEASSVVFGMPAAALARGAADEAVSLEHVAARLLALASQRAPARR